MKISKPFGWKFPWEYQIKTNFKQENQNRRDELERKRLARIKNLECDICGDKVDSEKAIWHLSGAGPFCWDCGENDPKWSAFKLEPRDYQSFPCFSLYINKVWIFHLLMTSNFIA
jgi:hypothetical protein